MTQLVGPVYIAHPYSAPTVELRRFNVILSAELSTTINSMGAATISPLQESRGREHALGEDGWLEHGLVLLRACRAVVAPTSFAQSKGCRLEYAEAQRLGILVFFAEREHRGLLAPQWNVDLLFGKWIESERKRAH